jgi:hypothetical protein
MLQDNARREAPKSPHPGQRPTKIPAAAWNIAKELIERAANEADAPAHRGGHRHGSRRKLMPWEVAQEARIQARLEEVLGR